MSDLFTKSLTRRIYYFGTLSFFLLFLVLTYDTIKTLPERAHHENLTPQVILGKTVWEKNGCIGCHTLLGEGAYYAPELGNVYKRRGAEFIKAWIKSRPTNLNNTSGQRRMPQFNMTEEELDAITAFLKWTSNINTANWPPNIEG